MNMTRNVGAVDRAARVVIGLALLAYALKLGMPETGWNWVGWFGLIPLVTALAGVCPLYSVVGLSTCPRR
ncbi:YgaP family membrane protein [Methylocystis heyeri]